MYTCIYGERQRKGEIDIFIFENMRIDLHIWDRHTL